MAKQPDGLLDPNDDNVTMAYNVVRMLMGGGRKYDREHIIKDLTEMGERSLTLEQAESVADRVLNEPPPVAGC